MTQALKVVKELRESGPRVPEDVSATGYDNIRFWEFVYLLLTAVNIPRAEIGHPGFRPLVSSGDETPVHGSEIRIKPELVIRETPGPAERSRWFSPSFRAVLKFQQKRVNPIKLRLRV